MHLFELAELGLTTPSESVPRWALGCFRRRSITFFTGVEDDATEVVWLQSRGLTADFRRPPGTVRLRGPAELTNHSLSELVTAAQVEGGFARTRYDGELMHWSDWASFQTHAKWPEPGRLQRIGSCLVEFAPSGAYVEDWRSQPAGDGPLLGLLLLDEVDLETAAPRHRGGGLIVCGRHAAFVRGRATELPSGTRLESFLQANSRDPSSLGQVFGFDASYGLATAAGDDFEVSLATLPWRLGQPVIELEGFSHDARTGLVVQHTEVQGRRVRRRFTLDTLEREFTDAGPPAPSLEGRAWFEREADTLLQPRRHRTP